MLSGRDTDALLKEKDDSTPFKRSGRSSVCCITVVVSMVLVLLMAASFGGGVILGWKVFDKSCLPASGSAAKDWGDSVRVEGEHRISAGDYISENIHPENIRTNLEYLTAKPHIAGKHRNSELASSLYDQWVKYGFDAVELSNYSVLLDYVNRSNYNVLTLMNSDGETIYTANTTQEEPLVEGEDDPDVPPPFNSYSGVGQAQGPLVYVNYGRIEDFMYLTNNLSLNLTGHICIARYGAIFRGNKAELAQRYGCGGLIIFSDPIDYAPTYGPPMFPDGPMLPSTGLQRGTVMIGDGDPLTPGLPSIDGVARSSYEEAMDRGIVPSIPVQPISYGDALVFMSQLSVHPVPEGWVGGLDIPYYITQADTNTNVSFIEVNNVRTEAVINDVIGVIYGSIEPDHLVILGNHRDAWTFGAIDPNSGTAVLMELARIMGDMKTKGWRPGRTIVLCSWDAEEYGLVGSTEWVEHYQKLLGANTIAYLNVDVAVSGRSHLSSSASPLLFNVVYDVAKQVSCPGECAGYSSVYDQWKSYFSDTDRPYISNLGSGSDFTGFVQLIGISCAQFTYVHKANYSYYAVYHSVHDNFYWSSHFGDPDYTHHKAIGEIWSRVAMVLSTTPILPYHPTDYAERLMIMLDALVDEYGNELEQNGVSLDFLEESIEMFSLACTRLNASLHNYTGTHDENVIRLLNKKLMNLERSFIQPQGLPGRPYYRHVIAAPSSVNNYAGGSFPGITDAIFDAQTRTQNWAEVNRQISIVAVHILYAAQIIEQPDLEWV